MSHFLTLKSVEEILDLMAQFKPLGSEELALEEAFGRTLSESFKSPEDLPGFDRSSMDGFAVRAKDVFGASESQPAFMNYLGECRIGELPTIKIGPGETARIWTGGMIPQGADAVVMLEYALEAGESNIELTRPVAPGENLIYHNEDASKGEELISVGSVLRPQEIGLLAALGQEKVQVFKKPQVAIISSGDEIIPIGKKPDLGQVRDVNSYTLSALAERCGADAHPMGLVGDSEEDLKKIVEEALSFADIILLSGGSSAGKRDYTVKVFEAIAGVELLAHGVSISPGKPLILARKGEVSLWGLPGHIASALVCAEVFIKTMIKILLQQTEGDFFRHGRMKAILARPVSSAQGRRDYIRVTLEAPIKEGEPPIARPIMGKSGLISTLVDADALIICPESEEGLKAGALVDLYPLS